MLLGLISSMLCVCLRFTGAFRLKSEKFFKEILKKGLTSGSRYAKIVLTKGRSEAFEILWVSKKFEKVFQKDLTNLPSRVIITVRCKALIQCLHKSKNGDNRKGTPN